MPKNPHPELSLTLWELVARWNVSIADILSWLLSKRLAAFYTKEFTRFTRSEIMRFEREEGEALRFARTAPK